MDKKHLKSDGKKIDQATRDRGDLKKSFLAKALEDLGINSIPILDCGDSIKTDTVRPKRTLKGPEKPASNFKVVRLCIKKNKVIRTSHSPTSSAAERKLAQKDVTDSAGDNTGLAQRNKTIKVIPKSVENATVASKVVEGTKFTSKAVECAKVAPKPAENIKILLKVVEKKQLDETKIKTPFLTCKDLKDVSEKNKDHDNLKRMPKLDGIEETNKSLLLSQHTGSKQLKPFSLATINIKKDDGVKRKIVPVQQQKYTRSDKFDVQNKPHYLDLEGRKRLREKYTLKIKSNVHDVKDIVKGIFNNEERDNKKQIDLEANSSELPKDSSMDATKVAKKAKSFSNTPSVQRKPIIKTIRLSNDNRVFKAVKFIDEKRTTPLQIKMPNFKTKAQEVLKLKNKIQPIASKPSVQMKPTKRKKEKPCIKERMQSPVTVKSGSPSTEVAKWAPSSVSKHTKPYYEAWVDTTLAAFNKCADKDKICVGKHDVIKTFKRALKLDERTESPDLFYEKFNDERYTGRIVVRRRNGKENVKNKNDVNKLVSTSPRQGIS